MDLKDVRAEGHHLYISVSKLMERPIKDVYGYFSREFGEVSFKLTKIVFEDGAALDIEGEHDFPYIIDADYRHPLIDEAVWDDLYKQQEED